MRFMGVEEYVFVTTDGRQVTVKEMREIPEYVTNYSQKHSADEDLDEMASRSSVYGYGGERDTYKLFEANMVALLDHGFDLSKLTTVAIPQ